MADQQIKFDFVASDDKLLSTANSVTQALTGVKAASDKASEGLRQTTKDAENASAVWGKQKTEIEQLYTTMGRTPSGEVSKQLDTLEKKFLELGEAAAKGNKLAADSMRSLLSEAKRVSSADALRAEDKQDPKTGFAAMQAMFTSGVGQAEGALGSLMGVVKQATGILGAFGAVLAGGAAFKVSVQSTLALTGEVAGLAKKLSITTDAASGLNVALKLVGGDADAYGEAVTHLNRKVRENEEALNKMGVQTRDANGQYRNQQDILKSALTALGSYKEGTDRNLASQALFGKGADDVTKLLKINAETMTRANDLAKAYGLTVGSENVANMKAYKESLAEMKLAFAGIENAVGNAVLPILVKLGSWFTETAPPVVSAFIAIIQTAGSVLGTLAEVVGDVWTQVKEFFTDWLQGAGEIAADIAQVFGTQIPKDFNLFREVLIGVKEAAIGFRVTIGTVVDTVGASLRVLMESFQTLARVAIAAFRLDWNGVVAAYNDGMKRVSSTVSGYVDRIVAKVAEGNAQIAGLVNQAANAGSKEAPKAGGGRSFEDFAHEKKERGGGTKSRAAEWENELNQLKLAHEKENAENGTFIEFSKAQEQAFWKAKLDTVRMSNEERYAIEQKYLSATQEINKKAFEARIAQQKETIAALDKNYAAQLVIAEDIVKQMARAYGEDSKEFADAQKAKIEVQKRFYEQQRQLADLATADRMAQAQMEVEGQRELAQLRLGLGMSTNQAYLDQEREFEQQLNELKRQALQDRLAQIDPQRDPVAHQQLLNQLLEQDRAYALARQKLESKITLEKAAPGKSVFDSFEQSFAKSATGILTRATTLKKGLANIWTAVGQTFIEEVVVKPVARYAAGLAEQLVFGQTAATTQTALATSTAATKVAASSSAAMVEGTNNAVVAGTGAMSALAQIPIVGPALAAVGGPAMIAMVMGMLGTIRSASGGFDIPRGVNPLTQLHAEEMVLPAQYANMIRSATNNGGGSTRSDGDVHVHINTVDRRGVERFLRSNQDAMKVAATQMKRTFKSK
ncbi:hypothetical protein [Paraburkholderia sp. J11-2]|uniref:phage tail protein n=1 Tax=Paraburkholderia sp. J11-2 TaxID=2805431 RepID=UPI002AB5E6CD|nr:hypothetical protein [Paraburkholderia sp. J11-2]